MKININTPIKLKPERILFLKQRKIPAISTEYINIAIIFTFVCLSKFLIFKKGKSNILDIFIVLSF